MIAATEEGQIESVKLLISERANVNTFDSYGNTALMVASRKGFTKIAELLIAKGADVNATNDHSPTTALM